MLNADQFGPGISLTSTFALDGFNDTSEIFQVAMGGVTSLDLSGLVITGDTSNGGFEVTGDGDGETIIGTLLDDTLIGNDGNDYLDGRDGSDTISGGQGFDTIVGGLGCC
jgi:Ca2+-binding RTX toxin-like protein